MVEILLAQPALAALVAAVLGLLVGSFLNVVSLRLPRMMEHEWQAHCAELTGSEVPDATPPGLVQPRSHCPSCGHVLSALENIPVVSYLWLRGRCSACGARISPQYPIVELLTGVLTAIVVWRFGLSWQAAGALALTWGLIALAVIDLREQLLPDAITLPLLWLGLVLSVTAWPIPPQTAIVGAAAGYTSLWLIYHAFKLLTGKEGMGYGDFKLFAVFGAWLGWQALPLIILLASLVGALVGGALIALTPRDRNVPIPFGPFLAAAGWIALLWGEELVAWYLGMATP